MADTENESGVIFLRKVPVVVCESNPEELEYLESYEDEQTVEVPTQEIVEVPEAEEEPEEQEESEEQEEQDDSELS